MPGDDYRQLRPDEIEAEVMLREPYSRDAEGNISPMVDSMGWGKVPVRYSRDCEHGVTICEECADSWQDDHFIRFSHNGIVFWMSPGTPTELS